jgi:predicted HicB family RNase H-like nuclease
MAKQKNSRAMIKNVISKHTKKSKKEISQLTIKIDKKLDNALIILSNQINISKNKLIEDILFESGILEEVDENYIGNNNE